MQTLKARFSQPAGLALLITGHFLFSNHALMAVETSDVACHVLVSSGPHVSEEPILCEIVIANLGDTPLTVLEPAQISEGVMSVRITDQDGRLVAYRGWNVDGPELRTVRLEPGEKVSRTIDLNAPDERFDLAHPGSYVVRGVAYVESLEVGPAYTEVPSTNAASFKVRAPSAEFQTELQGRFRRWPDSRGSIVHWRIFTDNRENVTALYCRLGYGDPDRVVRMARFRPVGRTDAIRCILDEHSTLHVLIPLAAEADLYDHFAISCGLDERMSGPRQQHVGRYRSKPGVQPSLRLAADGTVAVTEAGSVPGISFTLPATTKASWIELSSPASRPSTLPATQPTTEPSRSEKTRYRTSRG
jgi:hypothetical protein